MNFEQKEVLLKICIVKSLLVRNILTDFDPGKRKESIGDAQIFWIFGHQQPCRYGEKIYIYKIEDSYFVCVLSLFFKGVHSVEVSTVIFSEFFHHDVISWSSTCWKSFLTLKVLHQLKIWTCLKVGYVRSLIFSTKFHENRLQNALPTNLHILKRSKRCLK